MENRKANLFVVGAMKAGTTSFIEMLAQHPEIYVSPIKEPHYFVEKLPQKIYEPSRFFDLEAYFEKDFPQPLHITNVSKETHYEKLFSLSNDNHKYLAEASTGYLNNSGTAKKIFDYNPEGKIIILLRDPLKRAFSHYKMDFGLGRTSRSFQTEISNNLNEYKNGNLDNWSYLAMSLYADDIKEYVDAFCKNVLILNFENLENNLENLFGFLELGKIEVERAHTNPSSDIRFQKVLYVFKQIGVKDYFSYLVPKKLKHKIFNILKKKKSQSMDLELETKKSLEAIFLEDSKNYKNLIK
jgi:hypothetical protein